MSKKKNKFKKNKRHSAPITSIKRTVSSTNKEDQLLEKRDDIVLEENTDIGTEDISNEYAHVQKDVKKILIIMSSIMILLAIIYYLSTTTPLLSSLGDWIYKILNIQTL